MIISIFKNIWETSEPLYRDVKVIFKRIKEGTSKDLILRIRKEKDATAQNNLKKGLPSILFCGKFSQRKSEFFLEHSGLICLDIDSVKKKDIKPITNKLKRDKYTFGCFISPRANGFKVIVRIAPDRDNHKGLFRALEKYYNKILVNYKIDESGKDIGRVCYESYDPDLYHNPNSEIWSETLEALVTSEADISDHGKILDLLQIWIDNNEEYTQGNRNNYLPSWL